MAGEDCILCKIARHEIESRTIYEDQYTVGVLDIKPRFAKGQCVVFPKKHVARVYDLEDEDALWLFKGIKVVAKKIEKLFNPEHVSVGRIFASGFELFDRMLKLCMMPMFFYLNMQTRYQGQELSKT